MINKHIQDYIENNILNSNLKDMYKYQFNSGGKLFRPKLFLSLFEKDQQEKYLNVACAIEFIHNYSLIHDDLPIMDNDKYRRGKKTLWYKYNPSDAILIGDSLITEAINLILTSNIEDEFKIKLSKNLINASSINGMVLGQYLDINNFSTNEQQLDYMYSKKTGEMIAVCFTSYAILKNKDIDLYYNLGIKLGIFFQYQDDFLELFEDSIEFSNSDENNNKNTFNNVIDDKKIKLQNLNNEIVDLAEQLQLKQSAFDIIYDILNREDFIEKFN